MESPLTPIHFALATLFGASVMAISAFYIHKRSVDQVIDRLIKLRRRPYSDHEEFSGFEDIDDIDDTNFVDELGDDSAAGAGGDYLISNNNNNHAFGMSCSLPNVGLNNDWVGKPVSFGSLEKLVSDNLPPLRMNQRQGEHHHDHQSGSKTRVGSFGRIHTPRSPASYAYDGAENSDDDGTETAVGEDIQYFDEGEIISSSAHDIYSSIQNVSLVLAQAEHANGNQSNIHTKDSTEDNGIEKTELTSENIPGKDPNIVFPQPTLMKESLNHEEEEVRKMIRECLDLREKYVFREKVLPWTQSHEADNVKSDPFQFVPVESTKHHFRMVDGVVRVYASENDSVELFPVASATTFFTDMHHVLKIISVGNVRSACFHRLRFLEEKFRLHLLVNADSEFLAQKGAPHRDFYNIRKVDTHVHHSACMNQKHLLRFIKSKLRKEPDEVVIFRDGQYLTLKEVFESLDLTGYDLNVDLLDVHADKSTFHRFDKFNLKYNPCGQSRLREIFLKQDNLIQGRFLGELTKQVLSDLDASKYQVAEYRVSIYGRKQSEWDQLASWFINNSIYSENAVWLIQLPRLYNIYKSMGTVTSFQNILDNVFIPLFEVTVDPKSHPQLHIFLMQVVGLDLVDDESKPERRPTKHMPTPAEWTNDFNPAYSYYAYYCYANLYTLNKLRESKGLPTIRLRPHCGEAGDIDHLAAGFLLCHNISHGINLRKSPVLQYLYYLAQIGLAMSPLSNNSLFLDYHRNPFPMFFQRGMNVSLSTDDPLQIHLTKEPLVEEYGVAAKVWKLSSCDLCEIARNSVYQSGFSHAAKAHWLGSKYYKRGPEGNDIQKTNVPKLRIAFRHQTWTEEMQYVYAGRARLPQEVEY
ncbi:putative AMP deaminase [Helianthus annuus]|uniref:AMP deaminase n=1 Tax=Helianthus annuus TaxID=4232 RepID=A0A251RNK4_HELAN|nr:probable AMP deaminase [Helianthus annuus]KAF5754807.1 putative AMP deaminase [Helianthus annuus]KAJ0428632.1 putative AMP deaminase [Helianthus annuus]KAJ0812556.1 putative AMP deaminase [Helianthus annuus]